MKVGLLFALLSTIVLSGCTVPSIDQTSEAQSYHEIAVKLDTTRDSMAPAYEPRKELEASGILWSKEQNKIESSARIYELAAEWKCDPQIEKACTLIRILAPKEFIPPEIKVGPCTATGETMRESCPLLDQSFLTNITVTGSSSSLAHKLYGIGKDIYGIFPIDDTGNTYRTIKNGKEISRRTLYLGNEGFIESAAIINGASAITLSEIIEIEETVRDNVLYRDENMNEKYHLEESHEVFVFQNKIGFIGKENGQDFVFFNGKKVSTGFDVIPTHGCCAMPSYPFEVDKNGILFFVGKRGNQYFFVEIDLKKYF